MWDMRNRETVRQVTNRRSGGEEVYTHHVCMKGVCATCCDCFRSRDLLNIDGLIFTPYSTEIFLLFHPHLSEQVCSAVVLLEPAVVKKANNKLVIIGHMYAGSTPNGN